MASSAKLLSPNAGAMAEYARRLAGRLESGVALPINLKVSAGFDQSAIDGWRELTPDGTERWVFEVRKAAI